MDTHSQGAPAPLRAAKPAVFPFHATEVRTPARRDYKPEVKPVPLSALPFVCQPRRGFKNASNWRVPPTDDYGLACKMGA
ncbi:MAG: hypothetical protein ACYCSH_15540, partial [Acidithiobacillus sp.]